MSAFLPWTIVHVAVRERLPDLAAEPGSGGLFLVFWCDSLPVGQLSIPIALLPLTAAQLAGTVATTIAPAVAHRNVGAAFPRGVLQDNAPSWTSDVERLVELERPLTTCAESVLRGVSDSSDALVPSVSVVICTRNQTQSLRKCLASLRALSPPPDEVIVIDNDPPSEVTADVTTAFPGVRYVAEPRGGVSAARNAGIRHTTGAIVAFIGDDVVVHAGWIGVVRRVFEDPQVMASTGLVLPAELATRAQCVIQHESFWDYRASEFGELFFRTWRRVGVPLRRMGTGANMAFRREAFERTGVFDERLGACAAGAGEDTDLWYRLLARGHRCRYEPAAVVFQTQRREWPELSDQTYRDMRGHVAALLFQFDRDGYWGHLYGAFVAIPFECLTLAFKAVKRSVLTADAGRDTLVRPLLPQILGVIGGYGYYLRHRWDRANAVNIGEPGAEGSQTSRASVDATDLHNPPRPWGNGAGVRHVALDAGASPPHDLTLQGMTVYWRGDRPVGHILARPRHDGGRDVLRVVGLPRDALPQARPELTASVIICTRDRPDELARCLAALPLQTRRPVEIIVVDNGSRDPRVRHLALAAGATYVREDRTGLDHARNAGARRAVADIVAYTDDDVVLHPHWLERLTAAFDAPEITAATGLVLPAELATDAQIYFETFWSFNRGYDPVLFDSARFRRDPQTAFPAWNVGSGANMAFRRAALLAAGGFDARLDVGQAGCSGDSEMWHRLLAAGGACRYEPAAVAFHYHRRSEHDLSRQLFAYMRGHVAALLVQYERSGLRADRRRAYRDLPLAYLKRVWRVARGARREEDRYLREEIRGWCSGLLFYHRQPHA